VEWARQNLFRTWFDTILTLVSLAVIIAALSGAIRWVFSTADWSPITENFILYLVGQFPRPQLWRVGLATGLFSLMLGLSWGMWGRLLRPFTLTLIGFFLIIGLLPIPSMSNSIRAFLLLNPVLIGLGLFVASRFNLPSRILVVAWPLLLLLTFFLLRGLRGMDLLPRVEINFWGGLIVTTILAVGGITISFPIGVLLALGRRSSLPVVSLFSTAFIELVRGVPLISILFLFSLIVPLFLPPGVRFDRMLRALVGMIVFSAAYTAENVRGGLQAIPSGQYEAAYAIGLNNFQTTVFIVLPQALRKVIPAIVGQFISLFKDTTLASGVAVLELLSIGRSILQGNPEYIGLQAEVYVFIAAIFWIFSYSMSVTSRRLEEQLGVGSR
jgi:general L-amino acid transport system permease protein